MAKEIQDSLSISHSIFSSYTPTANTTIPWENIQAIYTLATAVPEKETLTPVQPIPEPSESGTPFDSAVLPEMTGFEPERIGIPRCEWTSPCYLLADRDLAENEVVRVWAVDRRDGRVLKVVELTATGATCDRANWPAALVKAIRDDDALVNDSKLLHAGVIKGTSFEVGTSSHSTADCVSASSREDYNRLWVFSTYARVFTNAPFAANQVVGHNLGNVDLTGAQRLCVQVRDRVSQGVFESIVVTLDANNDQAAQAKLLCERVGEKSRVMRAGALGDDGISIVPASQGNVLWIPQLSDLSVTVEPAPWVFHSNFTASRALAVDEVLRVHIHDDVTGMQLAGSPFVFQPSAEELDQCKWPAALAEKLRTSMLADYLVLALDEGDEAITGKWKCAGVPLRILMSAPLEEKTEWVPMLPDNGQLDQALTLNEQLLHLASQKASADADARNAGYSVAEEHHHEFDTYGNGKIWRIISLEAELQDIRTGHVCYHSELKFIEGYRDAVKTFSQKLMGDMRRCGISGVRFRPSGSPAEQAGNSEDVGALWLPKKLGMTGVLRLQSPKKLAQVLGEMPIDLTHAAQSFYGDIEDLEAPMGNMSSAHRDDLRRELWHFEVGDVYDDIRRFGHSAVKKFLNEDLVSQPELTKCLRAIKDSIDFRGYGCLNGSNGFEDAEGAESFTAPAQYAVDSHRFSVSDNAIIVAGELFQFKLEPEMISAGVRFVLSGVTGEFGDRTNIFLFAPAHSPSSTPVSVVGAFFSPKTPWDQPLRIDLKTPVDHIASFTPASTLCADRCMTLGAHVYDTGGARDNGVDENTGLFHAHYPLATLRGLGGNGPGMDLTLHYSAVRANEGALGDGWAFRFSYFDNRRRVLTLSSGQTLTLTKAQMKSLSADRTRFLDQDGYRITAVEGDEDAWTALTVQMPAGAEAPQEVLQLPVTHDGKEAGEAFKSTYKEKLEKIIANLTRWIDKEKITSEQIEDLKKQRETWEAELAEIDRTSLVLVTSSIRSAEGGELKLAWQGIEGHIRLDSITDTGSGTVLLRAEHGSIVAQGSSRSTFTVWPDTPECYEVTLDIRNCLLESIRRHRIGQGETPERHVRFGYDDDPELDCVLTSIAEEDGSLEVVRYRLVGPDLAPRVAMHTLVPGAGQPCISHTYTWKGDYLVERLHKRRQGITREDVVTHWTFNGGVRVVDRIVEEQPGALRRTTRFTYPATAPASDCKHLILSRPIKTEVTTESLASA
ncbi:hypothetical protein [Pseudomonas entomophila]|uniref:hypothetical protein n=1 Tax=Pseudomonas entomophila TaxID=312306 RepID=UPI00200DD420|nr:hypothetical protein [Pseudomonas entomophila]